jgi:hypothetical protein
MTKEKITSIHLKSSDRSVHILVQVMGLSSHSMRERERERVFVCVSFSFLFSNGLECPSLTGLSLDVLCSIQPKLTPMHRPLEDC